MHRRRRTAEQIRARIVDVAAEMAAEQPFAEISTREIARRAEVQQSVIYRYFPSKAALATELMMRASSRLGDKLADVDDPYVALQLTLDHAREYRELTQVASASFGPPADIRSTQRCAQVSSGSRSAATPVPAGDETNDAPLPGDGTVWTIIDRIAKHRGVDADDPDVRIDWILAGSVVNGAALMGDYLTSMEAADDLDKDEIELRLRELLACIIDGAYRRG